MKLYIKQKVFSWRERFAIKDAWQQDRWFAQGEIFTVGRQLHVFDHTGKEVAYIRQKVISFLPRYFIELDGKEYEIVKELTLFRPRYTIRNHDWTIEGNFIAHEYKIRDRHGDVMTISKALISWGDFYEVNIFNDHDELLCLCTTLAIDCMMADQSRA